MAACLLLQADEALWAGDKAAEGRLKGLITSRIQMIEAKGVDPVRMENRVHVIMTSNEDWVVPASGDERRFCVLDVGSHCERNNEYFAEIDDELERGGHARLLHELLSFDLKEFNIWDVPQTKALLDQKIASLSPIDEFWHSKLHDGALIHGDESWRTVIRRFAHGPPARVSPARTNKISSGNFQRHLHSSPTRAALKRSTRSNRSVGGRIRLRNGGVSEMLARTLAAAPFSRPVLRQAISRFSAATPGATYGPSAS